MDKKFEHFYESAKKNVAKFILEAERNRMKAEFEELIERQRRFGFQRQGVSSHSFDDWIDGIEIQKLKEEKRRIQAEIDEINCERKNLRSKKSLGPGPDEESRSKIKNQIALLTKKLDEVERDITKTGFEKFDIIYRQKKFSDNCLCSMAAPRPESALGPWPIIGKYQILCLIGRGGFSEVYKAYDLEEFKYVVVKVHHLDKKWDPQMRDNYLKHTNRENEVFKKLKHTNIVSYYDTIDIDKQSFATVLELCEGPDLDFLIKRNGCIPEREARNYLKQILLALKYLNDQNPKIIHFDIKP